MSASGQAAKARSHPIDETSAFLLAIITIVALLALGYTGRHLAPYSKGPVVWEDISTGQAGLILRGRLTGPRCLVIGQRVDFVRSGRDVILTMPEMGTVAVQVRQFGEYTVQPLTELRDVEGCSWRRDEFFGTLQQ